MTFYYQREYWPENISIICPYCHNEAIFTFVMLIQINGNEDLITFFKKSPYFEYTTYKDKNGYRGHVIKYFSQLHSQTQQPLEILRQKIPCPWDMNQHFKKGADDNEGAFYCPSCYKRSKHTLNWPSDAYFSIEYKSHTLWAFNKASAIELMNYIQDKIRINPMYCTYDPQYRQYLRLLSRIPAIFKSTKARNIVVKKLSKLLS